MSSFKQEKEKEDVDMLGAESVKNFEKVNEREFDTPSNNSGIRRLIPVRKILIYDLGNEKVEAMVPTVQLGKNVLRIDNWFYNQQFEPDFTISLTLGQLGLADGYRKEVELAKFWKIFIDFENGKGQKELKNLLDSDNHTKPNCTLIMRKKTPDELNQVKIEAAQDEEMNNQIQSRSQNSSSSNRSDSAESNSSSQSSGKSSAIQARRKKNGKQMIVKKTSTIAQQSQQIVKSTKLGRVKSFDSSQSRHNRDSSEEWLKNLSNLNTQTDVVNPNGGSVRKLPKTGPIIQQRESLGETTMSKCGQFKKYKNIKNVSYIACEKAAQIFNGDKERVHTDLESMRKGIIKQLNEISEYPTMKYKIIATPKYVTIKCKSCKTFQYWYQNDKEMTTQALSELTGKVNRNSDEFLNALEDKIINMKLYRRINSNHDLEKHPDVPFQ